jgi:hypothetical protein
MSKQVFCLDIVQMVEHCDKKAIPKIKSLTDKINKYPYDVISLVLDDEAAPAKMPKKDVIPYIMHSLYAIGSEIKEEKDELENELKDTSIPTDEFKDIYDSVRRCGECIRFVKWLTDTISDSYVPPKKNATFPVEDNDNPSTDKRDHLQFTNSNSEFVKDDLEISDNDSSEEDEDDDDDDDDDNDYTQRYRKGKDDDDELEEPPLDINIKKSSSGQPSKRIRFDPPENEDSGNNNNASVADKEKLQK